MWAETSPHSKCPLCVDYTPSSPSTQVSDDFLDVASEQHLLPYPDVSVSEVVGEKRSFTEEEPSTTLSDDESPPPKKVARRTRRQTSVRAPKTEICPVCQKGFRRRPDLKRHLLVHSDAKPFVCLHQLPFGVCGKAFKIKGDLNRHKRGVHSAVKRYVCDIPGCGTRFSLSGNLSRHKRTVHQPKTHACPICDKKFTQSSDVRRHLRVHTKERPFACELCGATFNQKGHQKLHMATVHKDDKKQSV